MLSLAYYYELNYKDLAHKTIMEQRVKFNKTFERMLFFKMTKKISKSKTWKELATSLEISKKLFSKYLHGRLLLPEFLFNKMLDYLPDNEKQKYLSKITFKQGNWGCIKGGTKSIQIIYSKYPKEVTKKWRQRAGRISIQKINKYKDNLPKKEKYLFLRKTKIKKSITKISKNEKKYSKFIQSKEILFDLSQIRLSNPDKQRKITIPKKLTSKLAEEIGIHLGDGTLSNKKYYYSVRGGYAEETYYTEFVLPLYKELFNINPPLLKRSNACGFEISSKGLREFKNNVLGIMVGTKTYKIKLPDCIFDSKDKDIYNSFLRGLIDTDGCYYYNEKKQYPVISIGIKSIPLLKKVNEILKLLGYSPCLYEESFRIHINGFPQFKKWLDEIGSSSPKNKLRIEKIKNKLPWSSLDRILACGASSSGSNPDGSANNI